ncbi:MAG: cobyric acid synthase [Deltaproteobacteria bacterium]|nr:cobyric acid synthase [Deltaproteobacteria bacterium]MBW2076357.1 cobyric acid synthase [Deltaproteobacteria bacterium]MBW2311151.1 cobyric acid synthase [Deltaproteobacteria bacterium]RLC12905.1 MAG: cobyric acid synthase CobQ [Deltaproteobacteria bacterium]
MTKAIMFLGTGSDVGKSIAATAFCRIFKRRGYKVAPFKAQNMSNNSYVTMEGGEIGRAQVVQAEAADVLPSVHMNPILLKPSSNLGSQIILHGKVFGQMEALAYHDFKPRLKNAVLESYERLAREYDLIVMEGAGSCCEMNLKENDLVNFSVAKAMNAPCILVADIDRGGVFAQIIGSLHLMTRKERELTVGFLINKFRGDPNLFSSGIEYIEKKTGRPVLGLIPFYRGILIDSEDSVAVQEDKRKPRPVGPASVNIAVVRFPSISNFTDLEILEREPDVVVNYLFRPKELSGDYDCLILPGAKNVMEDAAWLTRTGWKKVIGRFVKGGGRVLGICGGYQLLGERIKDPLGVESDRREVKGLNLLPIETLLEDQKVVRKVTGICLMNGKRVRGYEIHMGRSKALRRKGEIFLRIHQTGDKRSWDDGWRTAGGQIAGTYVHGILDHSGFRGEFLNSLRRSKGLEERAPRGGRLGRFHQYDLLADHFETHCDVEKTLSLMGLRQEKDHV